MRYRRGDLTLDLDAMSGEIDALAQELTTIPASAVRRFDQYLRRRWLTEPDGLQGWSRIQPAHVSPLVARSTDPVLAAAVLSMHPSGFVRESAVAALADVDVVRALPYLVIRAADWVAEVRLRASALVVDTLKSAPPQQIIELLPLVRRLAGEGSRSWNWAVAVCTDMAARLADADLVAALQHEDLQVRHAVAREVARRPPSDPALDAALTQHDPLTALLVVRPRLADGAVDDITLRRLVDSRFASLAADAALWLIRRSPKPVEAAAPLLLDARIPVRAVAQHEARRAGMDAVDFYRRRVPGSSAVLGLGETGTRDDAARIVPVVRDVDPTVRRAAIVAIGRLDPSAHCAALLPALRDSVPAVTRAASRSLISCGHDPRAVSAVEEILTSDVAPHVRRAALYVAGRLPRWERLAVALTCLHKATRTANEDGSLLLEWTLQDWNRSFTAPSADVRSDIDRLLPTVEHRIPSDVRGLLHESVRPYGLGPLAASSPGDP